MATGRVVARQPAISGQLVIFTREKRFAVVVDREFQGPRPSAAALFVYGSGRGGPYGSPALSRGNSRDSGTVRMRAALSGSPPRQSLRSEAPCGRPFSAPNSRLSAKSGRAGLQKGCVIGLCCAAVRSPLMKRVRMAHAGGSYCIWHSELSASSVRPMNWKWSMDLGQLAASQSTPTAPDCSTT